MDESGEENDANEDEDENAYENDEKDFEHEEAQVGERGLGKREQREGRGGRKERG